MILLHLLIYDLRILAWIGVVDNVAIGLILGTSLIDKYTQGIFPAKRKLMSWNPRPVDIVLTALKTPNAMTVADHIDSQL